MFAIEYTYDAIGPLHSIFVGSGASGILSEDERRLIVHMCREDFDSFTFSNATGFFRGKEEQALVIQVATRDQQAVRRLASKLAGAHRQVSIGIGEPDTNAGGMLYGRIRPI